MALLLEGRFQPIQFTIEQVGDLLSGGNRPPDPFIEILADPTVCPLSLKGIALAQLQRILSLRNTDLRLDIDSSTQKRGETELRLLVEKRHYGEDDWKDLTGTHGLKEGKYINLEDHPPPRILELTREQTPRFRIDIDLSRKSYGYHRGGQDGSEWVTGCVTQVILHEIYFHAMEFGDLIERFWDNNLNLGEGLTGVANPRTQHDRFLGNPADNDALAAYKRARTRFYLACRDYGREDEWGFFKGIERIDLQANGSSVRQTSNWWNPDQGPILEHTGNPAQQEVTAIRNGCA